MQADHRVTPGDDQDQHLHETLIGRADEIEPQPPDHRRTRRLRCRVAKPSVSSAPFLLSGPTSTTLTSVRAGSSGCRASASRNITVPVGIALASAIVG